MPSDDEAQDKSATDKQKLRLAGPSAVPEAPSSSVWSWSLVSSNTASSAQENNQGADDDGDSSTVASSVVLPGALAVSGTGTVTPRGNNEKNLSLASSSTTDDPNVSQATRERIRRSKQNKDSVKVVLTFR